MLKGGGVAHVSGAAIQGVAYTTIVAPATD